jgi:hypothetical protein
MVQDIGLTAFAGGAQFIQPANRLVRYEIEMKAAQPLFLFRISGFVGID